MIYTEKVQKALRFAIKTHEVYQKQKRKGKDIPYITHPLTAGLILALAGADEEVVIAGIIHDTIEDSIEEKKVTKELIIERFGEKVYELVLSVTEQNKELPWEERKTEALKHIKTFSNDSILLKSADIISNLTEIYSDYKDEGDKVFERFKAGKEKTLRNYNKVIKALINKWPDNPLKNDLENLLILSFGMGAVE
jgi:(p)ppGpp synthase/HD superfamily hydrolase